MSKTLHDFIPSPSTSVQQLYDAIRLAYVRAYGGEGGIEIDESGFIYREGASGMDLLSILDREGPNNRRNTAGALQKLFAAGVIELEGGMPVQQSSHWSGRSYWVLPRETRVRLTDDLRPPVQDARDMIDEEIIRKTSRLRDAQHTTVEFHEQLLASLATLAALLPPDFGAHEDIPEDLDEALSNVGRLHKDYTYSKDSVREFEQSLRFSEKRRGKVYRATASIEES